MTAQEVLADLETNGTAQNRKTYAKHGVRSPQFGVSFAHIKTLVRKIKRDQPLAEALWDSGNHDARILATHIADPARLDSALIENWAAVLDNYVLTGALGSLLGAHPNAVELARTFIQSPQEWRSSLGWVIVSHLAVEDSTLDDACFRSFLPQIGAQLHQSPNRTRHNMNIALIAIGSRNQALLEDVLPIAARIGVVSVDHGETGCKTPDATAYIQKTMAHKKSKGRW